MHKESDHWSLVKEGDTPQEALARLLIGLEELRVRLNLRQYPNLEISDEGHLWFNVPSTQGNWEVFVLPAGLGDLPGPALALSFPHRPAELAVDLVGMLGQAAACQGAQLFAAAIPTAKILSAYAEDRLPLPHLFKGEDAVRAAYEQIDFFPYCGLYFPVTGRDVQALERLVREVLAWIEGAIREGTEG